MRQANVYPVGYSHMLFQNDVPGNTVFFLSRNVVSALKEGDPDYPIHPVEPSSLLTTYGHAGMREILTQFGANWMSKNGRLYFRIVTPETSA